MPSWPLWISWRNQSTNSLRTSPKWFSSKADVLTFPIDLQGFISRNFKLIRLVLCHFETYWETGTSQIKEQSLHMVSCVVDFSIWEYKIIAILVKILEFSKVNFSLLEPKMFSGSNLVVRDNFGYKSTQSYWIFAYQISFLITISIFEKKIFLIKFWWVSIHFMKKNIIICLKMLI